jgi:coenzyme F420-0:L-glutamate ligase / coenzyme F420-1:gamma-L-glutamate ligase
LTLEIIPIKVPRKRNKFDLFESIKDFDFRKDDILVVSSKFVSMSEGAVVKLSGVVPSPRAHRLASECQMDAVIAELVLRESNYLLQGVPGFLLAIKDGMIAPNAGIDRSNVPKGYAILYPRMPFESARNLRKRIRDSLGVRVGVVISDSRLMPTRKGTTGVAIAVSGFNPVEDLRGRKDLFGNRLRVTLKAVADGFATMAVAVMGEGSEATPAAVVRGASVTWTEKNLSWKDMAVSPEIDIYLSARTDLTKLS